MDKRTLKVLLMPHERLAFANLADQGETKHKNHEDEQSKQAHARADIQGQ